MTDKHRSQCPITSLLDIVGDRWTLVILRDMINEKSRYSDFLASPERITTNILADRLTKMAAHGLTTKQLYQQRPKRYEHLLTQKGRDLLPVMQAMSRWSNKHLAGTWIPPEKFMRTPSDS